jgi:uncharacterized protein DUF1775
VRAIIWRGRTSADGLATFRFLASTPERAGTIAWKAIQTYRDGDVLRWIGSVGSDFPASSTTVSTSVPRENAGGEGGAGAAPAPGPPPAAVTGPDWLARGLALAALLAVATAALTRGRRPRPVGAIAAWRPPRT